MQLQLPFKFQFLNPNLNMTESLNGDKTHFQAKIGQNSGKIKNAEDLRLKKKNSKLHVIENTL